jgi:F0F1-type ATP synthase assembly protein I
LACGRCPLLYSARLDRSAMIEPGRGAAYAVLFSEIGISLLVTTLLGVLVGHWIDEQLKMTIPVFVIVGFLLGAGSGTVMIYRLVSRFLKTLD